MNNSKLFSDEAANIYERAIGTLLKKNMLLYFSFADYEEVSVHPSNQSYKCPLFLRSHLQSCSGGPPKTDLHLFPSSQSRMKYEKVHSIYNKLLVIEDIDPTLVYIQYMKFARRAEGIKSGRSIFKKAREDLRTRHHVFVSAALMEYYCSKVRAQAVGTTRASRGLSFSPMCLPHRINQWPLRSLNWV